MVSTVVGTLNRLSEAGNKLDCWNYGKIEIIVTISLTNNALVAINFSNSIGHGKKVPGEANLMLGIASSYTRIREIT